MEKCALTAIFFLVMTGFYTVGGACGLFRLIICYYGTDLGGSLVCTWSLALFACLVGSFCQSLGGWLICWNLSISGGWFWFWVWLFHL